MVEYLLANKAHVNDANLYGNTPLHMVAWLLNDVNVAEKVADILIKHGAFLDAKNRDGNTLLHTLIYNNNKELIDRLGKKYAFDMDTKNNDRESVVDVANRLDRKNLLVNVKSKR